MAVARLWSPISAGLQDKLASFLKGRSQTFYMAGFVNKHSKQQSNETTGVLK